MLGGSAGWAAAIDAHRTASSRGSAGHRPSPPTIAARPPLGKGADRPRRGPVDGLACLGKCASPLEDGPLANGPCGPRFRAQIVAERGRTLREKTREKVEAGG